MAPSVVALSQRYLGSGLSGDVDTNGAPAQSASVNDNKPMSEQGDNAKIGDENALFVKTVLPHQLTAKPPLGSWSVKKMVINDNTVPVHNPKLSQ